MPRSIQEIIDQADDLARRFEDYTPDPEHNRPAQAAQLIRHAARERAVAESHLAEAVKHARKDGLSWSAIGAALGTSGEAARQRYGTLVAH